MKINVDYIDVQAGIDGFKCPYITRDEYGHLAGKKREITGEIVQRYKEKGITIDYTFGVYLFSDQGAYVCRIMANSLDGEIERLIAKSKTIPGKLEHYREKIEFLKSLKEYGISVGPSFDEVVNSTSDKYRGLYCMEYKKYAINQLIKSIEKDTKSIARLVEKERQRNKTAYTSITLSVMNEKLQAQKERLKMLQGAYESSMLEESKLQDINSEFCGSSKLTRKKIF